MSTDINNACVTTLRTAWHLRRTATTDDTGSHSYPGGDRVELLAEAPQMVRGASEKGYNVKVVADGQIGFAFVPVADIPEACRSGVAALPSSFIEEIFPPSNSVVKAVGGSRNAAIATTAVIAAVGYYFYRKSPEPEVVILPKYTMASNPRKSKRRKR